MESKPIFICDYKGCEKIFTTKYSLIRHNQTHKKRKDFKCKECDKTFSIKQNLVEHEFVHTGELPYLCNVNGWGERFRQRGKLSLHRQSHKSYNKKEYRSHAAINWEEGEKQQINVITNWMPRNSSQVTPVLQNSRQYVPNYSPRMNLNNFNSYMANNHCGKPVRMIASNQLMNVSQNIANGNFHFMQRSMNPINIVRRPLESNITNGNTLPKLSVILMPNNNFGCQFY